MRELALVFLIIILSVQISKLTPVIVQAERRITDAMNDSFNRGLIAKAEQQRASSVRSNR